MRQYNGKFSDNLLLYGCSSVRSMDVLHNCLRFLTARAALLGERVEAGERFGHKDWPLFTKNKHVPWLPSPKFYVQYFHLLWCP